MQSNPSIAVLTGAGISAESGIATFRGEDGLWKKFKPEELATVDAFSSNPKLVWEWYMYRRQIVNEVSPNPGHYALVELENKFDNFTIITQNVDGLHQRAGSRNVIELHGNILRNRCLDCNKIHTDIEVHPDQGLPLCECGGYIRPDVVWFGEMLPPEAIDDAVHAADRADLFFSIGTSAVVHPAASLPLIAKRNNSYVVEINYEPTVISDIVDESIIGKSGEILPQLISKLTSLS